MFDVLRSPDPVQAVRPMHHWWLCPRGFAWFRVLMMMSLVKPPASAGPLSRIGDYLFAARGPGLFLWIRRRTTFPYESTLTRGPPYPLFHRRWGKRSSPWPQQPAPRAPGGLRLLPTPGMDAALRGPSASTHAGGHHASPPTHCAGHLTLRFRRRQWPKRRRSVGYWRSLASDC